MKLEGERWRTLVSTVRLGRDEYRVVQPARRCRTRRCTRGTTALRRSWTRLRRVASPWRGRPHTVVCRGFSEEPDHERLHHRDNRDLLRGQIMADTVFVVGSRPAFQVGGQALRGLVEDCPRHMHESPGTHCCAEITEDRQHWEWLHVVYCDEHRVSAR